VTELTTVKETVAGNIRAYRQLRGLDQAALAGRMRGVGIPWRRVTVSEVERNERNVTIAEALGLAFVLGTNLERLLDTRGPERMQGPGMVLLPMSELALAGQDEEDACQGREIRKGVVWHEYRAPVIYPEDLTALVGGHGARAVAEWDDETGSLKSLHYEHQEQPK
jgi:transcriptional regulator with XRE-family HTH domain